MDVPPSPAPVASVTPEALKRRIDAGETVTLIDTRPADQYERWQIRGGSVTSYNLPYTALDGGLDDEHEGLPSDRRLTAVCAIGKSSEYVAGLLAEQGYDVEHLEEGMEGWARLYQTAKITRYEGPGQVLQYQRPSSGCLGYLLVARGEALVVDPLRAFANRYREDAREHGATLVRAVDTHVHADHISGLRALRTAGVPVAMPAPAADRGLADAEAMGLFADGDRFQVGDATVEAVHLPGHTSDTTGFRVGNLLLTGDSLFIGSVARPDLEAGAEEAPAAARQLYGSLHERVLTLPDETLVCPGHHGETTSPAGDGTYTARLGAVRELDALSLGREAFVEFVLKDMPPRPANYEQIIPTNLGQRAVDDEAAFALELGPNNCAASAGAD